MAENFNIDDEFAKIYERIDEKTKNNTLTLGDTFGSGYYRLMEGEHAGKIVIKSIVTRIDGKPIGLFANSFTWFYFDDLKDVRVEAVHPNFSQPKGEIDRSKATWYNDNSDVPQYYQW